jgi:hypothetical protein
LLTIPNATCYSPYSFNTSGGGSTEIFTATDDDEEGDLEDGLVYLGSTSWTVNTTLPVVEAVYNAGTNTSASVTVGTQNAALEIHGQNLTAGGDDPNPLVLINSSVVTLVSVTAVSDHQINVSYSVAANAAVGLQTIGVFTYAGYSYAGDSSVSSVCTNSAICLNVGDPTPTIGSITPSQWAAGQQYACTIQIQGTGFGTNPALTIASADGGSEIASYSICGQPTDTLITASVTTNTSFVQGSVNITVQSEGYNGSGFVQAQHGESASATATVQITPIAPQPPLIVLGANTAGAAMCPGTNAAGTTQAVYVGQQIAFTGCLPAGVQLSDVTSMSWSPTKPSPASGTGTAVGGYNASTASGQVVDLSSASCATTQTYCDFPKFYWVDQGNNRQFTFTYTLCCGGGSKSATVTFNVYGPVVSGGFTASAGAAEAVVAYNPTTQQYVPTLALGGLYVPGVSGQAGIIFSSPALPAPGNAGTYVWVQLLNRDRVKLLKNVNGASTVQNCMPSPDPPPAVLDTLYPYGLFNANQFSINSANDTVTDSPSVSFDATWFEVAQWFWGTMYLMWDPTLPSGCVAAHNTGTSVKNAVSVASTCASSIPVPIASMQWQFGADAINTQQTQAAPNGTTWTVPCGPGSPGTCSLVAPGADPTASFPKWSARYSGSMTCQ